MLSNILNHPGLIYIYDLFVRCPNYSLEITSSLYAQRYQPCNYSNFYKIKSIDKLWGKYGSYIPLNNLHLPQLVDELNEYLEKNLEHPHFKFNCAVPTEAPLEQNEKYQYQEFLFMLSSLLNVSVENIEDNLKNISQKQRLEKELGKELTETATIKFEVSKVNKVFLPNKI